MLTSTLSQLITHRELAWQMAWRDLRSLNRSACLGWLWLIINPFIQTAVYVAVVSLFVGEKIGAGRLDYAIYVLSGLVPWQILTRTLGEAPTLIRARMDIVKQVVYPIETLPLGSLLAASCGALVSLAFVLALGLPTGQIAWTVVFLPLAFLLLFAFVIGASWMLMVVGAVLPDLREMVALALGLLVYLSPVVIREGVVSAGTMRWIALNPLTHVVICFRDVLTGVFHPASWDFFLGMTLASLIVGSWAVRTARVRINQYL